jgi:hypothetical protein
MVYRVAETLKPFRRPLRISYVCQSIKGRTTMLHKLRIALVVALTAVAVISAMDSASALRAGYGQFGGYDREGYGFSGP